MSERRIGRGLTHFPRDSFVLSSKVGYSLVGTAPEDIQSRRSGNPMDVRQVFDYSRDAVLRSIDESLMRLGTDQIEIVLLHDPDESLSARPGRDPYEKSHFAEVMEHAYPALDELRSQGAIQ